MARFVLQPCKLREDKFVPLSGEPPTVLSSWEELCKFFERNPKNPRDVGLRALQAMDTSGYLGVLKKPEGGTRIFHLWNRGRGNKVAWLIKKIPEFPSLLERVYFVQSVVWDARTVEMGISAKESRA